MKRDDDGFPKVGSNSSELGVRVPPNPHADVDIDENGFVDLNGKGMSVVEHWSLLPHHLIPRRLSHLVEEARGRNELACFRLGKGSFEPGPLNDSLSLALKPNETQAGVVAPRHLVPIQRFQADLAASRFDWNIEEAKL